MFNNDPDAPITTSDPENRALHYKPDVRHQDRESPEDMHRDRESRPRTTSRRDMESCPGTSFLAREDPVWIRLSLFKESDDGTTFLVYATRSPKIMERMSPARDLRRDTLLSTAITPL
ncbi:hypothetical protein F511_08888 [Dorcoceras hygrometricum]|uniref:Uncharacterized protein n=1 Tax=Dorcoceras hygrometricum TaxID=472368 RepID=A0A2Z7AWU5_9LAMI|nr:hypothetical protein F511_08888 [Dorcoceras hygrometricum]